MMAIDKVKLLKAKLDGIRTTLQRSSEQQKKELAPTLLAKDLNGVIDEVAKTYPDLKDALPKPVLSSTPARRLGMSDVRYLDVEIFVEQVLRLLNLVE